MGFIKTNEAVEYLIFEVSPERREEFIELDYEYWTKYLENKPGFIRKEIWVSNEKPNEVHSIIYWNTLEEWKSIDVNELIEVDKKFSAKFGEGQFKITREIHAEHNMGLYKVGSYIKD